MQMTNVRHILSLSGGKDSAALAVYMRDRVTDMEYIFHDTEKELPETYQYLGRLEAILGKPIVRTSPTDSFDHWLSVYGGMLPSNHRRWCTRMLKLRPFENYVGDDPVFNYVGLRADEARTGYISTKANITPVYPFREDGLVLADIHRLLEDSGLGMPTYTEWGRSRSGCYFCFYQQKIEWVRLKEKYPELYERAKEYEAVSLRQGVDFTWCSSESLAELERPERMAAIKANRAAFEDRQKQKRGNRTLAETIGGLIPEDEGEKDGCLICSL